MGGYGNSACFCFILCFVIYVFPRQSTGGEFVLFCRCFAVYNCSFEAGVVFDLDVVSFFSCVDACLFCDAFVGGVCVCLSFSSAYADGASRCVADGQARCLACFFVILFILFAFYGHSSCVSSNFISSDCPAPDQGVVSAGKGCRIFRGDV